MKGACFAKTFYLYLKSYSVLKINQHLGRRLGYLFEVSYILTKTRS